MIRKVCHCASIAKPANENGNCSCARHNPAENLLAACLFEDGELESFLDTDLYDRPPNFMYLPDIFPGSVARAAE